MTTPALLSTVQLVEHGPATLEQPAALALPDGAILLAWTGTLQHRSRNLQTVIDAAPVAGTTYTLINTPTGPVLLADTGQSWTITTNPLTATPGPTWTPRRIDDAPPWHATAGATTILATDYQADVAVWTTAGLGPDIPAPTSYIAAVWPGDETAVHVATGDWSGSRTVHRLTAGGTWTLAATGPATSDQSYPFGGAIPHGDDWLWAAVENTGDSGYAETFTLRDSTGALVHADPWPSVDGRGALYSIGGASALPDHAGAVLAGLGRSGPGFPTTAGTSATAAAFVIRDGTVTRIDLPLPRGDLDMAFEGSESAIVHVHGSTAVVLLRTRTVTGGASGLTAWTIDLGAVDSRLKVKTLGGWRRVGFESWEDGPGRLKLRVPTSVSPSGWVMEVKPGDDPSQARPMRLRFVDPATGTTYEQVVRMIPWVRP